MKQMKLGQYLKQNELTLSRLAKQCGTSASTIMRVKDAEVAPSKRVARAIWQATEGQVTPNDLYALYHADGHCMCQKPNALRTPTKIGGGRDE